MILERWKINEINPLIVPNNYFDRVSTELRTNKLNKFNKSEFLESHKLPKLTQKEIDNLDIPLHIKETKFLVKKCSDKEHSKPRWLHW